MKYGAKWRYKKIFQYNLNGELVNVYKSLDQMHELTGYRKDYISAACRHQYSSANGYLWIYEDEKESIENLLNHIPDATNCPVLQYDLNGNFIAEYSSYSVAAKAIGCAKQTISNAANNLTYTAKGFYWKNKNDNFDIKEKIIAHNNVYNDRKKKIIQLDKNNNIIQIFNSIQDAANAIGKPSCRSAIGKVCQGKQQTSCGFKWAYAEA